MLQARRDPVQGSLVQQAPLSLHKVPLLLCRKLVRQSGSVYTAYQNFRVIVMLVLE